MFKKTFNKRSKDKPKKENKNMETSIRVIYSIGSKSHKKEFKRYALYGKWMCENWRSIRIVDISVKGDY